jgi:hypothetical protein
MTPSLERLLFLANGELADRHGAQRSMIFISCQTAGSVRLQSCPRCISTKITPGRYNGLRPAFHRDGEDDFGHSGVESNVTIGTRKRGCYGFWVSLPIPCSAGFSSSFSNFGLAMRAAISPEATAFISSGSSSTARTSGSSCRAVIESREF